MLLINEQPTPCELKVDVALFHMSFICPYGIIFIFLAMFDCFSVVL